MAAAKPRTDLDHGLMVELAAIWKRVCLRPVARILWNVEFTAEERKQLGYEFPYHKLTEAYSELRQTSLERAVVELAFAADVIEPSKRKQLILQLGENPAKLESLRNLPSYDAATGKLTWGNQSTEFRVRTTRTAPQILLEAFERANWRDAIKSPLGDSARTHQVLSMMNRRLEGIHFHAQGGDAREISWSPISKSPKRSVGAVKAK
jgi:hypothetical protein